MELGWALATESLEQAGGRSAAPDLLHVVQDEDEAVAEAFVEPFAEAFGQCLGPRFLVSRGGRERSRSVASSGRSGRRRRNASTKPRAKVVTHASGAPSVYQAQSRSRAQPATRVDFPNPAPATTVVRRLVVAASRCDSSRGRRM